MPARGSLALLAVTVAPWSALGAVVHSLVFAVVLVPAPLVVLQPGPLGALGLSLATLLATILLVYRLIAPGGLEPARAKFMTVVSVCAALVAAFCAALLWYAITYVVEGGVSGVTGVIGLLGAVAFAVALGASADAVVTGFGAE